MLLGGWLHSIRPARGTANENMALWARRMLDVLGMRWYGGDRGSVPASQARLAVLVREEDNAQRENRDADADTARQQINEILGPRGGDRDWQMLRAAVPPPAGLGNTGAAAW